MKKAEKSERGWLIVNLLILMLLAGGFLFINAYVDYVNEHEVIYRLVQKQEMPVFWLLVIAVGIS